MEVYIVYENNGPMKRVVNVCSLEGKAKDLVSKYNTIYNKMQALSEESNRIRMDFIKNKSRIDVNSVLKEHDTIYTKQMMELIGNNPISSWYRGTTYTYEMHLVEEN